MLKALFVWLDGHPDSYWFFAYGASLLLTNWIGALVWREARSPGSAPARATWRDALVLFLFIVAWRWPFLLVAGEFNPDESQQIAGAITLAHDPVFWRSVDGNTSGPLNFYILLPLHWLGAPLDYFTARLTGLLMIWGALFICLRTLARFFGRAAAWLGVLPVAAFFALVMHPDLVQYSTEHLPLLVVAAAFGLLAGRQPEDRRRLWVGCFLAGTLPWTKLQTAPIGLTLIGWGLWQVWRESGLAGKPRLRRVAGAGLAAALPTLLIVFMIIGTGQTEPAVRRYLLHNIFYVGDGSDRPLAEAMRQMTSMAMVDGRFPLLLVTTLAILLAAATYFIFRRVRPSSLLVASSVLSVVAFLAVITPRREFLHYVLLLPVPFALWTGAAVGGWWTQLARARSRVILAAGLFLAGGFLPLAFRTLQPPPGIYGDFAYHWRHPRSNIAVVLHALAGREGSLGIWGWANNLYVETGLPQATRDAVSLWSILPNGQQDYHRATYLADLRRSAPPVFVDAVGPNAFGFEHRYAQAHEIFPELADYIRENYVMIRDVREARIYVRKGIPLLADLTPHRIDLLLAQGRANDRQNATPPPITAMDKLTRKEIGFRSVMMILPPTLVEWQLEDDVRAVSLEFGFDPEAYERGKSNGAEVILEIVNFEQTRQVFRRLLDPARRPADRGHQTVRVILPPFSPGSHLVLRTDPGQYGDNAWDWVYFSSLQFRRNPGFLPEQFPGFSRVPDAANAESSSLLQDNNGTQLQLHAPAALKYVLDGGERHLSFVYGFHDGAYMNGGHTDGAIYRVELQSPGRPNRLLLDRYLQPAGRSGDRGPQQADLDLPAPQPGDTLMVSIDPGPAGNAAWDWTYIYNLTLK